MKSRKVIAYLMALAIAATAASTAIAVSADDTTTTGDATTTTADGTTTTTADTTTTTAATTPTVTTPASSKSVTEDGVVYTVYNEGAADAYAEVSSVYSSKTEIFISDKVNGAPVTGFEGGAFDDANNLKTIVVAKKNGSLRVVNGALYKYTVKEVEKDGKKVDEYTDVLVAVPAGLGSFTLSKDCVMFAWEDDGKDSADFPNGKVKGNVNADHPTYKVVSGKLHYYTTTEKHEQDSKGNWSTKKVTEIGDLANDKITWAQVGANANPDPGTTTKAGTEGEEGNAPQTGVAGIGVALATLLAAGATAVVLRKRTR